MDRRLRTVASVALAIAAATVGLHAQSAAHSRRLRAIALERGYNLDHAEALATFEAAIAADSTDPATVPLLGINERESAEREMKTALRMPAAWVRGRAHKELGKLADLAGDRAGAIREFQAALGLCRAAHDSPCADESVKFLRGRP